MAKARVNSGICGFTTEINAIADDNYRVLLQITSECALIRRLAGELTSVEAFGEVSAPITETATYQVAARCRLHAACPVPCAIIKSIEVSAGLALPLDVTIQLERD